VDIFSNIDNITIHLEHKEIPESWRLNWAWSNYDDYSLKRVIILNSNKSDFQHNYTDIYSINDDQLRIEQLHLNSITEIVRKDTRQKQHLHKERLENYPMGLINPTVVDFRKTQRNELIHKHNSQVEKLNKIYENPYFIRIDLISSKKYKRYYIGEAEYSSFVIDWRSDIGRLYRNKKFTINLDKREFQVSLIRRYKIGNREILEVDNEFVKDSKTAKNNINDPFLQKILREKRDKGELTNIISSIQIKQNEIIDYGIGDNFDGNFIVQGCAGSGKTMILLHRIANIIYNLQDFDIYKACIITPNKHFNTYINELTVDLGIDKISRKTIDECYLDIINKAQRKENSKLHEINLEHTSDRFDFDTQKLIQSNDFLSFIKRKCDEAKLFHEYYILKVETEYLLSSIEKNNVLINDFLNNNQWALDKNESEIKLLVNDISNSYQKICESKMNNAKLSTGFERDSFALDEIKHLYEKLPAGIIFNEEDIFNLRRVKGWDDFDKHYKINQNLVRFKESDRINEYEDKSLLVLIIDFFKNVADLIKHLKNDSKRREELKILQEAIKEDGQRLKIKQRDIDILRSKHVNITINELYKDLNVNSTITKIFDNVIIDWNKTHESKVIDHSVNNRDTLFIKTYMVHHCLGFIDISYKYLFVDEGQDIAKHEYDLLNKICNNKIVFNIYGDLYQKVPTIYGINEWEELEMPLFHLSENYRNGMEIVDFYNTELKIEDLAFGLDAKVGRTTDIINDLLKYSDNERESNRIAFLSNDKKFIKKISEMLEEKAIVGDTKKGLISLMSIVQVKGLEFDIVYVDRDKLTKNEKYIAYSRAIKELYIVDN
jgi:DNA helicase IV